MDWLPAGPRADETRTAGGAPAAPMCSAGRGPVRAEDRIPARPAYRSEGGPDHRSAGRDVAVACLRLRRPGFPGPPRIRGHADRGRIRGAAAYVDPDGGPDPGPGVVPGRRMGVAVVCRRHVRHL